MKKYLPLEAIQDWLEDVRFRPFGLAEWSFNAEPSDLPLPKGDSLDLIAINRFARNSRSYDWDAETDEWTMLDGGQQTLTMTVDWPRSFEKLEQQVAELVAYAGAHEALEWLNIDGKMPHDPHVDGDVVVRL